MEIGAYESLADCEKCMTRLMQDKELMTEIFPEFASFFAPAPNTLEAWNFETYQKLEY
jgi:hypothetical protein